jgi:hypothetical protein
MSLGQGVSSAGGGIRTRMAVAGQGISRLAWSHTLVEHRHYENRAGKLFTLSPRPIEPYWEWTRALDPSEYELR